MPSQPSHHRDLEAPPHCAANGHARSGGKQKHEPPPASAWRGPVAAALCTSVCPPSGDPVTRSLDSVPGQEDKQLDDRSARKIRPVCSVSQLFQRSAWVSRCSGDRKTHEQGTADAPSSEASCGCVEGHLSSPCATW